MLHQPLNGSHACNNPCLALGYGQARLTDFAISSVCRYIFLLLCLQLFFATMAAADAVVADAWFEAHNLNVAERKKLQADNIVLRNKTSEKQPTQYVQAFFLVQTPVEHLFNLIKDSPQLVEYAPYVEKVEVLAQSEQQALINCYLVLPFAMRVRYRLQLDFEHDGANRRMAWQLVPWPGLAADETIVSTTGYWLLEASPDGATTLVSYQTIVDPGPIPFGFGWIVHALSRGGVVDLLKITKQRAEQQWQGDHD